jgi:hypothetical protein
MEQEKVVENIDDVEEHSQISENCSMNVNIVKSELDERELDERELDESDGDESDGNESDGGSEYTEVDLTQNEMYQVLSTFLESSEGYNLCDIILALKNSIDENNQLLRYALTRNVSDEN